MGQKSNNFIHITHHFLVKALLRVCRSVLLSSFEWDSVLRVYASTNSWVTVNRLAVVAVGKVVKKEYIEVIIIKGLRRAEFVSLQIRNSIGMLKRIVLFCKNRQSMIKVTAT